MLLPRRLFLFGSTTTTLWWSPFLPNRNKEVSLDDWADLICADTPESFRQAVQQSHHFLYRGAADDNDDDDDGGDYYRHNSPQIIIQHPEPDLLIPGTYEDPEALDYFKCLEKRLLRSAVAARPSTGHVATSDPMEAGQWGPVVSVWPLGTEWSYVYPKDRSTLFVESSGADDCDCDCDALMVDRNLLEALQQPREVLFASYFLETTQPKSSNKRSWWSSILSSSWQSAFLTIPIQEDAALRQKLQERNHGF
jgi:hypothetical protein